MPGRRALCRLLLVALCALPLFAAARPAAATAAILDPALAARLVNAPPTSPLSVVVTYSATPADADFARLDALGVRYAPLSRLPMAGALATPAQIAGLRQLPNVVSVYLNGPLQFMLHESVPLIGATRVWQDYGYTGDGVGVAVIDTGIDATHADLLLHQATVQNVKVLGLQAAAGQNFDSLHLPQIFLSDVPNTDWTGGHGTHVAGIIGATGGASGGYYKGVAPGADLIGLGVGEGIDIFTALAGFDWTIAHKQQYNIRVVNCSWGNSVPGFDPNDPVNVATRQVHDAGIAVVFAAGNSGATTNSLNTYSVAPWVIGVAAGEKDGQTVAFFSSRGIPGDSFYHPTLTAPGYLIASDRTPTGTGVNGSSTATDAAFIAPQYLPYYTVASGTSMAAPHVAGTIALMAQANSALTPDVIKRVLVNTARPLTNTQEYAAGAGYLDTYAAVTAARAIHNVRAYHDPNTGRDTQVYDVTGTWTGSVDASLPGVGANDVHALAVQTGTQSLDVAIDWTLENTGQGGVASDLNLYLYDPSGALVASSEVVQSVYNYANETVHVNAPVAGVWTAKVSGFLNAPQPYNGTSNAVVLAAP
jgi:serine protease AprX